MVIPSSVHNPAETNKFTSGCSESQNNGLFVVSERQEDITRKNSVGGERGS